MTTGVRFSDEDRARYCADVLRRIAEGENLSQICRDNPDYPRRHTFRKWARADPNFDKAWQDARDCGEEEILEDCLRIADTAVDRDSSAAANVRIHTRFQLAAKFNPKRWGNLVKHAGHDGEGLKLLVSSEDAEA